MKSSAKNEIFSTLAHNACVALSQADELSEQELRDFDTSRIELRMLAEEYLSDLECQLRVWGADEPAELYEAKRAAFDGNYDLANDRAGDLCEIFHKAMERELAAEAELD